MAALNIKDLQREVAIRQQKANEVYEKILALVHKKIIATNEKSDDYNCIYKLPNFMYGYPIYDARRCMEYLMTKLSNNGFEVRYIDANSLYISWKPDCKGCAPANEACFSRPKVPVVVPDFPSTPPAIQYNPYNFQPYPVATTSKKSDQFDVRGNYSSYSMQFRGEDNTNPSQSQMIENNIRSISGIARKDKNKTDVKFVDIATFQPSNEIPF
jgi:hypothetical protein